RGEAARRVGGGGRVMGRSCRSERAKRVEESGFVAVPILTSPDASPAPLRGCARNDPSSTRSRPLARVRARSRSTCWALLALGALLLAAPAAAAQSTVSHASAP